MGMVSVVREIDSVIAKSLPPCLEKFTAVRSVQHSSSLRKTTASVLSITKLNLCDQIRYACSCASKSDMLVCAIKSVMLVGANKSDTFVLCKQIRYACFICDSSHVGVC